MMRYGAIVCVLAIAAVAAAQAPPAKQESRSSLSAVDQQEIQALTNDVARMRTLLQQMQMNLAFVQTTQTPLKHQFELEIEMWQAIVDGMERRLQRLRGTTTSGVVLPDTVPLRHDSRQRRP